MAGSHEQVPVTTGCDRSRSTTLPSFGVEEVWFPAGRHIQPHRHGRTNLAVMLEGSFDLGLHARVLRCPTGSVLIEPAGERHWNRMDGAGAHVLVIQIDPRGESLGSEARCALRRSACFRDAAIPALAWRMSSEFEHPDAITSLAIEGLGLEILAVAARRNSPEEGQGAPPRSNTPISEIAIDCGFADQSHLTRLFRRHLGTTPDRYRRATKND